MSTKPYKGFEPKWVKEAAPKLKPGLYIVNGRKMVVK